MRHSIIGSVRPCTVVLLSIAPNVKSEVCSKLAYGEAELQCSLKFRGCSLYISSCRLNGPTEHRVMRDRLEHVLSREGQVLSNVAKMVRGSTVDRKRGLETVRSST
jgi:hypothetical protein